MEDTARRAVAVVGVGAILPDAPSAAAFRDNLRSGRSSLSPVTPDRWDPALYFDPDPRAPDKTYSALGGWVRSFPWEPIAWKLPIPPKTVAAMDEAQKWAVACTREALADYGYPGRPLDTERTAVILGNAMAGEQHYRTALRISMPEILRTLAGTRAYAALPASSREALAAELVQQVSQQLPPVTEDTMPGELASCVAGRVAHLFNLRGPNYVCDAACASAMAAIAAAADGLAAGRFDAVVTGGVDRSMGAATFVKFSKIGALSATGSRPYAAGADGFVMGEGAVVLLLKRLADAERDGDRVYAVLRGIGGASDGRGKGITAPNPAGQRLAIERAWTSAGVDARTCSLVEGHGPSTPAGDAVEVEGLSRALGADLEPGRIPLGSVKSNIGHLKGAAGAAGLLKTVFALHDREIPASLNFGAPNPDIDFGRSPFRVPTTLAEWPAPPCGVRRAGVSSFGFGGTNFHAVVEEHQPGRLTRDGRSTTFVPAPRATADGAAPLGADTPRLERSHIVLDAASLAELAEAVRRLRDEAMAGRLPRPDAARAGTLGEAAALVTTTRGLGSERLGIEYGDARELAAKAGKSLAALETGVPGAWKALRGLGVFRASGPAGLVAFLYTGQGSQYVNMLRGLRDTESSVRDTFAEADAAMQRLLGRRLSECVFADPGDAAAIARAEEALRDPAFLQPAILAADLALTRLLADRGIRPDLVMGHSLGEYAALVAAGALPFAHALEAVSARGREMESVRVPDPGRMAAVLAPLDEIERLLATVDGYVVVANYNARSQSVIGGESAAVEGAAAAFTAAGRVVVPLPVSHAFHTAIVSPATGPLRAVLERLDVRPPSIPVVANVTGEPYPSGEDARPAILDLLSRQMAAPVQFAKGLRTLFDAGARVFVEVGPKRALQGFAEEAFADDPSVLALFTNHPKLPDAVALGQAVCGLRTAAGSSPRPPFPGGNDGDAVRRLSSPAVRREVRPVVLPPLALCRPTGVTLERGRRVVVMADAGGVGLALARRLEGRGVKVLLVERRPPAEELTSWLRTWLEEGPIHGVYWLAALDAEGDAADAAASFREAVRERVFLLHATMRALLAAPDGRSAFLVAGTRTGRLAGGPALPLGAAVAGIAKALQRERPAGLAKVVELAGVRPGVAADILVDETLRDGATVDVAVSGGLRLSLAPSEAVDLDDASALGRDSIFVVSGASRPGVPALVRALAEAVGGGTFHLIGAATAPGVEPVEDLGAATAAVAAAGGRVLTHGADLRNEGEAAAVAAAVSSQTGHVDVLVHADAPRIDGVLEEKEARAFAFVFDTRVEGWRNLTAALATPTVGRAVVLQPAGSRCGEGGADAAAAAEWLAALAARRPEGHGPCTAAVAWDGSPESARRVAAVILGSTGGETVVTSPEHDPPVRWDDAGALDAGKLDGGSPLVAAVRGFSLAEGLRVETALELPTHGHRVAGRRALPEAVALETLAETAALLAPGWHVSAIENAEFRAPLVLGDGEPGPVEARALLRPDGRDVVAECRLVGAPAGGGATAPGIVHVVARVRLTAAPPPPAVDRAVPRRCAGGLSPDEIYRVYARGPESRVLEGAWRLNSAAVGLVAAGRPSGGDQLVTAPRLFEACVQMSEVLDTGLSGRLAAPVGVERVGLACPPAAADGARLYAIVRPASDGSVRASPGEDTFDARVVDERGNVYLDVRGCRTAGTGTAADPAGIAALRDAMA